MKVKWTFFLMALMTFFPFCFYYLYELAPFSFFSLLILLALFLFAQAFFYAWGFYNFYSSWGFKQVLTGIFYFLLFLCLMDIWFLLIDCRTLRFILEALVFYMPVDFILRILFKITIKRLPKKKIAFLGDSHLCKEVAKQIAGEQSAWNLVAFFTHEKSSHIGLSRQITWFSWTDLCVSLSKLKVDLLVWEDPLPLDGFSCIALPKQVLELTQHCSLVDFIVATYKKVPVKVLRQAWVEAFLKPPSIYSLYGKRVLDLLLLVCFSPVLLVLIVLTAFLTKITSRGKVIYKQLREGYEGEVFTIYKFRSMTPNAEESKAQWAKANDSRVTSWGKIMRKLRLDELPQVWNILKGDMSWVGPRPERPEFTKVLSEKIPYYKKRNRVKPGLTGWAQVNYPYGASVEDALRKTEYDLYYVHRPCLSLDFKILIKTFQVVLMGKGQ